MCAGTVDGTIRGMTSTRVPTCHREDSVATIRERLVGHSWDSMDTVYVLADEKLVGRIDVTALFQSDPTAHAADLMEPARARLRQFGDRERAVYLAIKKDRDEIPVVDRHGGFIGAVTSQTIIDTMHRQHIDEILMRAGVKKGGHRMTDLVAGRVGMAVRSRVPWLLFGLLAGLFLSIIASQFEGTMRETIALAFFPPVIAYVADSVGTQSETIAIRAFAVTDIEYRAYLQQELFIGIIIGLILGALGGVGATVIADSASIGGIVALSLFVSSAVATVLASLIPMGFLKLDIDPALGSGPLATALQDAFSIAIYFLLALTLL